MAVGYGLTEAPTGVARSRGEPAPAPGYCGVAIAQIELRVVDESGDAVAMVLVSARKAGANEPPKRMPALGGSYAIDSLEPGRYLVSASRLGTGGLDEQGPEIEVEVVAGKTAKARLTVPSR